MPNRQGNVDLHFAQVSARYLALWLGLAWLGLVWLGWLPILPGCMRRGKLPDYVDENSGLIFDPDTLTANPYNPSATFDVLDIILTKDVPSPVHMTSCSALSSDYLSFINDTIFRSSFLHPPYHPNFRCTYWANLQACQEKTGFTQYGGNQHMR
jgi:hypothetical protein